MPGDEFFFEDPENQNSTFWMSTDGFHTLCLSFVKKIQNKVYECFYEITICENTSSNPLQKACSGFPIAACDSKSCSESRLWSWNLFQKPAMNVYTE